MGVANPLTVPLAAQNASSLGDRNSHHSGIGRNGVQKTPEVENGDLLQAVGAYPFMAREGHNRNAFNAAGALIKNHGDVRNRDMAYAVLSAIAEAGG